MELSTPLLSPTSARRDQCGQRLIRVGTAVVYVLALALVALIMGVVVFIIAQANPIEIPEDSVNSFWGISYNPARANQWCPTVDQVVEDLRLLAPMTTRLRTYGSGCHLEAILGALEKHHDEFSHFRLMVGIQLTSSNDGNQGAIREMFRIIKKHSTRQIDTISVGNEVVLRHTLAVDTLINLIRQVRNELGKQYLTRIAVVTVDVLKTFTHNPRLVHEVDYVVANLHPYFVQGLDASQAAGVTFSQLHELQDRALDKPIIIGETGWPSSGDAPRTSIAAYNTYMKEFICQATRANIHFYWFEAFDAAWKTGVDEIERHWGVFDSDRHNKSGLALPPFNDCN
ncbi:glucan endo-1,3-beta-D-glucosidase [Plasmodiophora brassicae]|uniref:glucan endo-1,3-beta-D-glucosidase n=1 Tax=Plasmodiophora brassicae TaxID=37360 RepID=A0A0G4IMP1_PLABS|nr:hypothetical protein PBRA_005182 [Plasmodiophora brassicae]SPQ94630.1 unnamed protein product [Plasmodiophora brassicae]